MTTRRSILIGTAVVAGAVLWYLFRPEALIVDRTVNEPLPVAAHSMSAMAESPGIAQSTSTMAGSPAMAQDSAPAMGEPPAMAHSAIGAEDPAKLASGQFHSNAHETRGSVTVFRLADGRRVLRLTEFATSNGPDVRVYLVAAADVQDEAAAKAAGFVDLGPLKGNIGDQNYDVPADADLNKYRTVSIWCARFGVNFGTATLASAKS